MKKIYIAWGILVIYAILNIYLEKTLFLEDLTSKTVFSLLYLLIATSPIIYFWIKGKIPEKFILPILVLFLGIFYTSVLVTSPIPVGRYTPDVAYHGAKSLYCSSGYFFNDPVTSTPSIYPPVYHIIVGSIMRLIGTDNNWYVLNCFHIFTIIFLFLSIYLLANSLFNPRVGFLSVLFFVAIIDMPIESGMFFPTPFMLGLTVIINSVTLVYLALKSRKWCLYPAGFLTGLAVTIWPAFLPVAVILVVIIFFTSKKESRRLSQISKFILSSMIIPLVVWIPQYLLLSRYNLLGHHTIGQYKGIPGVAWFLDFAVRFIFLGEFVGSHKLAVSLFALIYLTLIVFAIRGLRSLGNQHLLQRRFLKLFLILMFVALPVVHYVFTFTYSRRFQVLLSILITILAVYYLLSKPSSNYRALGFAFILCATGFAGIWNYYTVHGYVMTNKRSYEIVKENTQEVMEFLRSNTNFGDYIFATARTYREVVFGNIIRFNLKLHREGGYYSLNPRLSQRMLSHYNAILSSNDLGLIKRTLGLYKIKYALIHKKEPQYYPGLKLLIENCERAYKDKWFTVLKLE